MLLNEIPLWRGGISFHLEEFAFPFVHTIKHFMRVVQIYWRCVNRKRISFFMVVWNGKGGKRLDIGGYLCNLQKYMTGQAIFQLLSLALSVNW